MGDSKWGVTVSPGWGNPLRESRTRKPATITRTARPSACFHRCIARTSVQETASSDSARLYHKLTNGVRPTIVSSWTVHATIWDRFRKGPLVSEHWGWLVLIAWLAWWLWGVNWQQ